MIENIIKYDSCSQSRVTGNRIMFGNWSIFFAMLLPDYATENLKRTEDMIFLHMRLMTSASASASQTATDHCPNDQASSEQDHTGTH